MFLKCLTGITILAGDMGGGGRYPFHNTHLTIWGSITFLGSTDNITVTQRSSNITKGMLYGNSDFVLAML